MKAFLRVVVRSVMLVFKVVRRACMLGVRTLFRSCGRNVIFDPFDRFSHGTISIGDDVYIGPGAIFLASESAIVIGRKVMFGPAVTIMGGDHNTSVVGAYMFDVKTKRAEDDQPVVIEDDVWVGSCVIILKGVTIGRGSVIAAGSVVTRSVPPYSICAGVPARVLKSRFDDAQLSEHRRMIEGP